MSGFGLPGPSRENRNSPDVSMVDDPPSPTLTIITIHDDTVVEPPPHTEEVSNQQDQSSDLFHRSQPTQDGSILKSTKPMSPGLNGAILSQSDDYSLCTICTDPLTNSGEHRVVSLYCGHTFGHRCIERWIKDGDTINRCPTCNKQACLKDIRVLYPPKVVPLDTVEKEQLIAGKNEVEMKLASCEMKLSRCERKNELIKRKYDKQLRKMDKMERELVEARTEKAEFDEGKKTVLPSIHVEKDRFTSKLLQTVDISQEGGCKVMAFNHLNQLIVSSPCRNTLNSGYGVQNFSTAHAQRRNFLYLHSQPIQDLAFHLEDRDLLLSVSLDQTAKLVDLASNTLVHTLEGGEPLWSCCWNACNPHLLLTGSKEGKVCQYDRRMMDDCVNCWDSMIFPVTALAATPSVPHSPFPQGGFLWGSSLRVIAFARHGATYKNQRLPVMGSPFLNMRYDDNIQTLITTTRASYRCPAKINLDQIRGDFEGNIYLSQIHTFSCGSSTNLPSRLTTLPVLNDSLVVAHHESGRTINMWSSKTGNLVTSFPIEEPVIDLTPISSTSNTRRLLAALSDKRLFIYKVT